MPGEAYDTTSLAVVGKESPETLAKFNPGLGPQEFDQLESAKFVPKGSDQRHSHAASRMSHSDSRRRQL